MMVLIRQVQSILSAFTGKKIAFGTTSVTITAAVNGSTTVNHGLGRTPELILLTARSATGRVATNYDGEDDTSFIARARVTDDAATTATVTVGWLAVG